MEVKIIKKATRKLGEMQVRHPIMVLAGVLAFTLLILPGMLFVYFDTSNENFLPENDPIVDSLFVIGSDFGGASSMHMLFFLDQSEQTSVSDLRHPEFLHRADLIAQSLGKLDYVDGVISPTYMIKNANNGVMPDDYETVARIISENEEIRPYFNSDFSIMRMSLSSSTGFGGNDIERTDAYYEMLANAESVPIPSGIRIKLWGNMVQFIELQNNLASSLGLTTLLGFIAIFLLIVIFYRSLVSGILSITPILFALLWTIGAMGYVRLPFTMLTSGFIPIVLGFGIDYSIHLMHNIKHLQEEGKTIENAVLQTLEEIGEAIFAATATTVIGFLSLLLASLLITQRLGMTLALSVAFVLLACIVIVPPVMLLKEKYFNKTRSEDIFVKKVKK